MLSLDTHSDADRAALERLATRGAAMLARTIEWARHNTGSYNVDGLNKFAPVLADAFSALDAAVTLEPSDPFEEIGKDGTAVTIETAPVLRASARRDAPCKIIMSGHYDTVFEPGTFETITDLGNGKMNGPGLADMKGGLVVMLEALLALEAGPHKDQLGYEIVITPDEEVGNFASARYLTQAAQSGALLGMTYEPCLETGDLAGARKGSSVYDIVLRGKATHAGRAKAEGASAIEAAAQLTVGIEALNDQKDGVSINVGAIDGGAPVNIVPDLAIVRLGARAPTEEDAAWLDAELRRLLDTVCARPNITGHLHGGFYRPPKPRNAAQQALFNDVHQTGKALGLDIQFEDTGGVCEGNNIFAAGVPNVDTLGVVGGRIHSSEEFVVTDSFAERASLSALLLHRIADGRINAPAIHKLMG